MPPAAQNAPPQPPSFRCGVDIVRLDVSVLEKDRRPVRDLTRDEITILVNGESQPIVSFEPVAFPTVKPPTGLDLLSHGLHELHGKTLNTETQRTPRRTEKRRRACAAGRAVP